VDALIVSCIPVEIASPPSTQAGRT
jgi:hypothetical protein